MSWSPEDSGSRPGFPARRPAAGPGPAGRPAGVLPFRRRRPLRSRRASGTCRRTPPSGPSGSRPWRSARQIWFIFIWAVRTSVSRSPMRETVLSEPESTPKRATKPTPRMVTATRTSIRVNPPRGPRLSDGTPAGRSCGRLLGHRQHLFPSSSRSFESKKSRKMNQEMNQEIEPPMDTNKKRDIHEGPRSNMELLERHAAPKSAGVPPPMMGARASRPHNDGFPGARASRPHNDGFPAPSLAQPRPSPPLGSTGNGAMALLRPGRCGSRRQGGCLRHCTEAQRQPKGQHAGGTPALPGEGRPGGAVRIIRGKTADR